MNDTYNPGREQVRPTAAPILQTERARMEPDASVDSLLRALGTESTQREVERFNRQHEETKLREQQVKFDWYVEQFQKDHAGGAVSEAQVKARFPETVPIIASRIAESIGQQEGRKAFQAALDEVSSNDALRLDSKARVDFLAKKREEIVSAIPNGSEFYGSGVVAAMDKLAAQHEFNWRAETATYHQKVQVEQFSSEVVDAFNSGKPESLLDLDARWGQSSSLNTLERNKAVVSTAIDLAFTSDDQSILQKVPARFLNAESKADLTKAKVQLTDRRFTEFRRVQELKEIERAESLRNTKLQIVEAHASGKPADPALFRGNDEAYRFALQMLDAGRLPEAQSVAAAQTFRNSILNTASMAGPSPSLQDLTESLLAHPGLNSKEKQALMTELPKLVEGRNLMADDMVRQPVSDRLNPRLQALEQSTNSTVQTLLTGRNLRSEVMRGYDMDIRRSFLAEFEETGRWPMGHRKLELIDRAVDRAEKRLEEATRISSGSGTHTPTPAPRSTASNTTAPTGLPPGVKLIN